MTGLSAVQYQEAALRMTLTITEEARTNLKKLNNADLCLWTGVSSPVPGKWKNKKIMVISLENAVKINFRKPDTFELDPKHIQYVFVHEKARKALSDLSFSAADIEKAIGMSGAQSTIYRVRNGRAKTVDLGFAKAIDEYFNKFKIKVFDVDELILETVSKVKSSLRSDSSNSPKNSDLGMKRGRKTVTNPENDSNKRRKISTDAQEDSQKLNLTDNISSQLDFKVKTHPEEVKLTTLFFGPEQQPSNKPIPEALAMENRDPLPARNKFSLQAIIN